ncbi:hypothetical protein GON26_17950 [Flavobacterium sp. GA093]|uniref:NlpE N-terminal domain-containing protein n=1 Tax=Flavobacterium hydrocarbonoxydans TaxID=2683249 RepID=A0A6I4NPS3_9FLAO|nr:hypothetical protein [Flavobacterium hydrocarbonoxydans]MWB96250.1 hypothetical protein [Flavobacterium hydrocarbonoxydans]
MKTKLLALILLLIGFNSHSQEKKLEKGVCKIEHKCYTTYQYDDFDDIWTYSVGFYETMLAKNGLTYIITKYVENKTDKKLILLSFIGNMEGCRSKNSYVHIQFKNGEKLKIDGYDTEIKCGTTVLTVDITEQISLLEKEPIDKIRISIDGNDDFVVTEKGQTKFFNNLKCIDALDLRK